MDQKREILFHREGWARRPWGSDDFHFHRFTPSVVYLEFISLTSARVGSARTATFHGRSIFPISRSCLSCRDARRTWVAAGLRAFARPSDAAPNARFLYSSLSSLTSNRLYLSIPSFLSSRLVSGPDPLEPSFWQYRRVCPATLSSICNFKINIFVIFLFESTFSVIPNYFKLNYFLGR